MKTQPKLSFKINSDCQDKSYVTIPIGEFAEVKGGIGFPVELQGENTTEIPFFKVSDMELAGNELELLNANNYVSLKSLSENLKCNFFDKPAVVFAKVGAALLLDRKRICRSKFLIDNNMMAVMPNTDICKLEYLYYDLLNKKLSNLSNTGALPSINASQIKEVVVRLPCIEEQQKIAAFFTALDEKIQFLGKKLKLKHSLKHSMMDKVFSQNVRFQSDTCEPYQDWIALELGSCCAFYAGQTPKSTCSDYYGGEINWVASGDLNRGVIFNTEKTITNAGLNSANLKIIPKGSFVIALFGLEAENVCGNCGLLGIDAAINQACLNIKPNEEILLTKYLFYYYQHFGKSFCKSNAQGTKQQNLNIELISQFAIKIPCIEEQRKICVFFDQIEKSILLLNRKLCCLKELKKAFMQRMFV